MSTEIVKVQVPIVPKGGPALIYAKEESPTPGDIRIRMGVQGQSLGNRVTHQSLDKAARDAMKSDLKGFFMAEFKDGKWKLGRRVRDQGW